MNDEAIDLNEVTKMYRILGLPLSASIVEVRHARNKLLAKFHPDKQQGESPMDQQTLNERTRFIQTAFIYINEHYAAIQQSLEFLSETLLTNQIPVGTRSYWVYTSIERLDSPDQEA
jgi:hypothetical protein